MMARMEQDTPKIKGWHVFTGFAVAFGIIISVNIVMAFKAVSTFPGLEVANSYVASQQFDKKRQAQEALQWSAAVSYDAGEIVIKIADADGAAVAAKSLRALVGRTTTVEFDTYPEFVFDGTAYRASIDLAEGLWLVKIDALSRSDIPFQQRLDVYVGK